MGGELLLSASVAVLLVFSSLEGSEGLLVLDGLLVGGALDLSELVDPASGGGLLLLDGGLLDSSLAFLATSLWTLA